VALPMRPAPVSEQLGEELDRRVSPRIQRTHRRTRKAARRTGNSFESIRLTWSGLYVRKLEEEAVVLRALAGRGPALAAPC